MGRLSIVPVGNDFFCSTSFLLFLVQGRFTIAAKHHISVAEIYESELVDIEKVRQSEVGERKINASVLWFSGSLQIIYFCYVQRLSLIMNKQLTTTKERSQTGKVIL